MGMTRMGCEERGTRFSMENEPWAAPRGGRKGSKPEGQEGKEWAVLGLAPALQSPASAQLLGDGSVVLFMPPHTYFLIWQYFQNVVMLDTEQWPCTNILLNSICIISTFSTTFFSLDVQQYRI